jgi:radical SAM protein with 4Fe4S-binding SPASM domain
MTSRPTLQSLIFEVTQRCNHACLHCYNVWHADPAYPRGELDTSSTLDLLAKALHETFCSHVTLTGGEPLLRSDLPQILEFLQKRHVQCTLISNGRLLALPKVKDLVRLGVGLFELPLLGDCRQIHDELSGSDGAWDAVLAAMADIRLARGQFVAAFVATRKNVERLPEVIKLAFAFGARAVMLNRFNPGGRGRLHIDELLPSTAQVRQALASAEAAALEYNLPISCSIPIQPCLVDITRFPHLGFGYCAAGTDRAYYTLDPLGNVRPCNHTNTILGNLFDTSFSQLVASKKLESFKSALPPHCLACPRSPECQGGCKASAQVCYGSLSVEEPFLRHGLLSAS